MTPSSEPQRIRIYFRKEKPARFLSHLDLMATLEYALRRARLPVALSEGFNPRPRMSLAAPLAVGYTGEREILEVVLHDPFDPEQVRQRLQAALPAGIVLTDAAVQEEGAGRGAASRLDGAVYRVRLARGVSDLQTRVAGLLARDRIDHAEERDGAVRTRDIRPYIRQVTSTDEQTLLLSVSMGEAGSVRPETILDLLGVDQDGVQICRERIDLR